MLFGARLGQEGHGRGASMCLFTWDVNLDRLVVVCLLGFSTVQKLFPLVTNECPEGDSWRLCKYAFSLNISPTSYGAYWWVLPAKTITVVFTLWWFSISLVPSTHIHWNSSVRNVFHLFIQVFIYITVNAWVFILLTKNKVTFWWVGGWWPQSVLGTCYVWRAWRKFRTLIGCRFHSWDQGWRCLSSQLVS